MNYPKTPQPSAFADSTNLNMPGTTGRNVTFAQTPSGMMSVGPGGSRDLFSSPMHAPDSASTARKKDMFRQRRMDKGHGSGRDEVGMMSSAGGGILGSATQAVEHDLGTIRSEYDLLYPQPVQAIRGAGSGPGLVGGHHNTPGRTHMDSVNTSVAGGGALGGFLSPQGGGGSFLSGPGMGLGGITPIPANQTAMSVTTPHHAHSISAFGHEDALPLSSVLRAAPQDEAGHGDGWVTVFGFPQGFQDGVLRHLRDRGDLIESHYSGTNYVSVRFNSTETVAEVLALHGTILPADGMPGENYMIGVKRGAHHASRKGASKPTDRWGGLDASTASGMGGMGCIAGGGGSTGAGGFRVPGGKAEVAQSAYERGGLMDGFGRFISELLDITDLGSGV